MVFFELFVEQTSSSLLVYIIFKLMANFQFTQQLGLTKISSEKRQEHA